MAGSRQSGACAMTRKDRGSVAPPAVASIGERWGRPAGPPPVHAPGQRARPIARTTGWAIFIGLAVALHAAIIVPVIAGREGPDGVASASTETITVVDSGVLVRPTARDPDAALPAPPAPDETPRFELPQTAALEPPTPAPTAQGPGRGAALLPFDVLPMPPPSPPAAKKSATPQKTDVAALSKPAATRRVRVTRPVSAEQPPAEPDETMPAPYTMYVPPPPPPPPPPPRYSRRFWWGVWCGAYVSCD